MRLIFILFLAVVLSSCKDDRIPDVSHIEVNVDYIRYEQELMELDSMNLKSTFLELKRALPAFTDLYFNNIVPINQDEYGDEFYQELSQLIRDERFRRLVDTTGIIFPRFEERVGNEIENAFRYYKYYFPEFVPPDIYTLVSEYAFQKFLFESDEGKEGLGLGLDLFLGSEFPYHRIQPGLPAFSKYLTRTFDARHIPRKVMMTIMDDRFPVHPTKNLLDHIIHNGKKLYFLDKVLPGTPDSIIMEYTGDQMEWVKANELEMWSYFFGEKLFYESNLMKINKYINPSPDSPGMPAEAPGQTGNYLGWQIIKAYMEMNPETTPRELIEMSNAQGIMDRSKFRPKKVK